ncbi:MAG: hypothetical protein SGI73_03320 [Chloroflexota bacterium]|nr:hypothetical protein [Chloroflexota bacterium]
MRRFRSLLVMLVIALSFVAVPAVLPQETAMVECDQDVILSKFIAERYFNYAAVIDVMIAAGDEMDFSLMGFEEGQFTPMAMGMMGMMDSMMAIPDSMVNDMMMTRIIEVMRMSDEDMMSMMMMEETGEMTMLMPPTMDEAPECSALRESLRRFFIALSITDMEMMGAL